MVLDHLGSGSLVSLPPPAPSHRPLQLYSQYQQLPLQHPALPLPAQTSSSSSSSASNTISNTTVSTATTSATSTNPPRLPQILPSIAAPSSHFSQQSSSQSSTASQSVQPTQSTISSISTTSSSSHHPSIPPSSAYLPPLLPASSSPPISTTSAQSLPQIAPAKRKAGRPRDSVADSIAHEVKRSNAPSIFRCNYCDASWAHYNPYRVKKHGLDCKGMPADLRLRLAHEVNLKQAADRDSASKRAKLDPKRRPSSQDQKLLESLLLESIITSSIPLHVFTNSSMRRLFQYSSSSFILPSKSSLQLSLIPSEIDSVKSKIFTFLQQSNDLLSFSFDIFTTSFDLSLLLIYATTRSGSTFCIAGHDFPHHSPPSPQVLASCIIAEIERVGPQKVLALISSPNPLYRTIRLHVLSKYPHLISLDPLAYYFEQLAVDLCRFPVIEAAIRSIMLVYSYFHRFAQAEKLLSTRLAELNLSGPLRPFLPHDPISLYSAALSVRRCMPALVRVISTDHHSLHKTSNKATVVDLLSPDSWTHRDFVDKLETILVLFRPLDEAVTRLRALSVTLADVHICWSALTVYFRDLFQSSTSSVASVAATVLSDRALREHVVYHINLRWTQQLDSNLADGCVGAPVLTLAMFLHPVMALHEVQSRGSEQQNKATQELFQQLSLLNSSDSFFYRSSTSSSGGSLVVSGSSHLPIRPNSIDPQQQSTILYDDLAKFRHRVDSYALPIDSSASGFGAGSGVARKYWLETLDLATRANSQYQSGSGPGTSTTSAERPILPTIANRIFDINACNSNLVRVHDTISWLDTNLRNNVPSDLLLGMLQCRMYYLVERARINDSTYLPQNQSASGIGVSTTGPTGLFPGFSDLGSDDESVADVPTIPDLFDDCDLDGEIEYMHDPRSWLVHRYDDELTAGSGRSLSQSSHSQHVRPSITAPSRPASPGMLHGLLDVVDQPGASTAGSRVTSRTASVSEGVVSKDFFELENVISLANFRRTDYCFDPPYTSSMAISHSGTYQTPNAQVQVQVQQPVSGMYLLSQQAGGQTYMSSGPNYTSGNSSAYTSASSQALYSSAAASSGVSNVTPSIGPSAGPVGPAAPVGTANAGANLNTNASGPAMIAYAQQYRQPGATSQYGDFSGLFPGSQYSGQSYGGPPIVSHRHSIPPLRSTQSSVSSASSSISTHEFHPVSAPVVLPATGQGADSIHGHIDHAAGVPLGSNYQAATQPGMKTEWQDLQRFAESFDLQ
ncbi:uncharacterized protein V1516DRAFT_684216 [Lipomyces oligophaga]|uniref:uncharacterized protein n=1 Tax=Lipomyces oligophaga TaxID=45792 RepID=UPI0034CFFD12